MEKTFDAVDLFTASSLAMIASFIIFVKSFSWCSKGGVYMTDLTGISVKEVIAAIAVVIILLGLLSCMWTRGKTENKDSEWWTHPLGLPTGSVRALIAILFIALIAISGGKEQWLVGIVGTIIGFYFGERTKSGGGESGEEDSDEKLGKVIKIPGLTSDQIKEMETIFSKKS